ncbi:hypothetical protein DM860_015383 [Cuscuta australis]|uniref:Uncharacterized protein n=1 Tax=Cuscuta australis TaxID=267555 RepID=A0A328DMA4_9ASTE|nr:hypothetical protein DM860_015383 [Cuscuta australis]
MGFRERDFSGEFLYRRWSPRGSDVLDNNHIFSFCRKGSRHQGFTNALRSGAASNQRRSFNRGDENRSGRKAEGNRGFRHIWRDSSKGLGTRRGSKNKSNLLRLQAKVLVFFHSFFNNNVCISEFGKKSAHIWFSVEAINWLVEILPRLSRKNPWAYTRFEKLRRLSVSFGSNSRGNFIRILESREEGRTSIFVPVEIQNPPPFWRELDSFRSKFFVTHASMGDSVAILESRTEEESSALCVDPETLCIIQPEIPLDISKSHGGEEKAIARHSLEDSRALTVILECLDPLVNLELNTTMMEDSVQSITSALFQEDIKEFSHNDYAFDICCKGDFHDEFKLLEPIFNEHFESLFKETACYIREALTIELVHNKLQEGLLKNGRGKVLRLTRQVAKGVEVIDSVKIKGTKHPVCLIYANEDSSVIQSICGAFLQGY